MPHPTKMSPADTALLVIDVQEKLVPLTHHAERVIKGMAFLIAGAKLLGVPLEVTEQYPKGLGKTVAELAARLPAAPEKVAFSCFAVPSVIEAFRQGARTKILLAGIEA